MAIRRGPLNPPTTGTSVFNTVAYSTSSGPYVINAGFPPDMAIAYYRTSSSGNSGFLSDRLRGKDYYLFTRANSTENDVTGWADYSQSMNGIETAASGSWTNGNNFVWWNWKRAPSFFDVVAYTGTGSARTVSHNLGAAPEMMWVKSRSDAHDWVVYHKDTGTAKHLRLNSNSAAGNDSSGEYWGGTTPTASVFSLGNYFAVNGSSKTYMAYLFASVDGVSKVGSYTGTGNSDITVDCGFSSGARFVLIKKVGGTGSWYVADTARGLVSGTDKLITLNTNFAETTGNNMVDPSSSGFIVSGGSEADSDWNDSGHTFIFYAIA